MKDIEFIKKNLIAHRGYYNDNIPENSLGAFRRAIIFNYIIELDIELTKDKEVVVFHDYNLKRMTGVNKNINEVTLEEIGNYQLLNTSYKIPTLDSVLKLVNGSVPIIIEFKLNNYKELVDKTISILDNYIGDFTVTSFNPLCIAYLKLKRPHYITGYLVPYDYHLFKKILFLKMARPDYLSCSYKYREDKRINNIKKNKIVIGFTITSKKGYQLNKAYFSNLVCDIYKIINN